VLNDIPEETGKNDVVIISSVPTMTHKKRVVNNCDYPCVGSSMKSELIWVFAFC